MLDEGLTFEKEAAAAGAAVVAVATGKALQATVQASKGLDLRRRRKKAVFAVFAEKECSPTYEPKESST